MAVKELYVAILTFIMHLCIVFTQICVTEDFQRYQNQTTNLSESMSPRNIDDTKIESRR